MVQRPISINTKTNTIDNSDSQMQLKNDNMLLLATNVQLKKKRNLVTTIPLIGKQIQDTIVWHRLLVVLLET